MADKGSKEFNRVRYIQTIRVVYYYGRLAKQKFGKIFQKNFLKRIAILIHSLLLSGNPVFEIFNQNIEFSNRAVIRTPQPITSVKTKLLFVSFELKVHFLNLKHPLWMLINVFVCFKGLNDELYFFCSFFGKCICG